MFAGWWIPLELGTYNGPQFAHLHYISSARSTTSSTLRSSPLYPQANGAAKKSVGRAKRILRQPDPQFFLLSYRSTPIAARNQSPAQLIILREITTVFLLQHQLGLTAVYHQAMRTQDQRTKPPAAFSTTGATPPKVLVLQAGQCVTVKLDVEKS